jgi:hypothetical protein
MGFLLQCTSSKDCSESRIRISVLASLSLVAFLKCTCHRQLSVQFIESCVAFSEQVLCIGFQKGFLKASRNFVFNFLHKKTAKPSAHIYGKYRTGMIYKTF